MNHRLKPCDSILVSCSHDLRVAERGADLFLQGFAPYIIFSGGFGRLTKDIFEKTEAETFAEIARNIGVPEEKIIIENISSNSGENIEFTKELLARMGLNFNSFTLVFSQVSIDGRGQNRLRLRAGFFFAALNPPVGAGGSDPSSQP